MRLKVFGIGLNRTASLTLRDCLVPLGYYHLGARRDLLVHYRQGNLDPIFREIDRFDTFDDWPWPLMYRELFARYGDRARYVLTRRRSADVWLEDLMTLAAMTRGSVNCRKLAYGHEDPSGHEAEFLAFYERHLTEVRSFFREQRAEHLLLDICWEDVHDWGPLCGLMGIEPPAVPFPQANVNNTPLFSTSIRVGWPHVPYLREAS